MAEAKYDVLGIGNAIFDVLVQTDEKFLSDHRMTKGGMTLIDEARAAAIYRDMGPSTQMSGGSAAAPPMSARSRTIRSAGFTRTTSAPRALRSTPDRRPSGLRPAAPISW